MTRFRTANYPAVIAISLVLFLGGCSGFFEGVRSVTYPPDFNYISRDELTDTMQQFALYTTLLDQALRDSPVVTPVQRSSAIKILAKMEHLALDLGSEKLTSNHDIVSLNIDRFRNSIAAAKRGLQQQPPDYYRAGAVSSYCLSCHALAE